MAERPEGFIGRHTFGASHNEGTLPRGKEKWGSIAMFYGIFDFESRLI